MARNLATSERILNFPLKTVWAYLYFAVYKPKIYAKIVKDDIFNSYEFISSAGLVGMVKFRISVFAISENQTKISIECMNTTDIANVSDGKLADKVSEFERNLSASIKGTLR